jgi:pimeloyl-ACP methyl ester carboxylesterase/DNA-binding CsgD family transcriptional regulator
MEPPPVQYVRTSDGYDIAYWTVGNGRPFVYVPGQFSDLNVFWHEASMHGPWMQGLAERFRLTSFDGRGQGMSTRGIREPQTIESLGHDLEAVAERTQASQFVLLARWYDCHLAVRYAVTHPERVSALILIGCAEENSAWPSSVYEALPEQNWEVFLLSQMARATFEKSKQTMDRQNQASTREDLALRAQAFRESSVALDLSKIEAPTLVLHPRDYMLLPVSESRAVAAKIPGAHFAYIEGEMLPGDAFTGLRAIEEFLGQELPEVRKHDGPDVTPASNGSRPIGLSPRQLQVLQLIARGKTNRELAEELVLSERTVQRHIADLYVKIDVRNRSEATSFALSRLS